MYLLIRSYFCYITKITVFFKHLLITYIVFSSTAYPLSNNNKENREIDNSEEKNLNIENSILKKIKN